MSNHAREVRWLLLVAAGVMLFSHVGRLASAADQTKHSAIRDKDHVYLWDYEVLRLINERAGTNYKDLHLITQSCFSEGFVKWAAKGPNKLAGAKWTATASRGFIWEQSTRWNKKEKLNAKPGYKIGDRWYHGWAPQWNKYLSEKKADATLADLAQAAWKHDAYRRNSYKLHFKSAGDADQVAIHKGARGYRAIIFTSTPNTDLFGPLIVDRYKQFKEASFTDAEIDFAWASAGGNTVDGVPVDRDATWNNFKTMLDDLKVALDANPDNVRAVIYLNGHGTTSEKVVKRKPDPRPNTPKQGARFDCQDPSTELVDIDDQFVLALMEENPLLGIDNPCITRDSPPLFHLTTSEEFVPAEGSGSVSVLVDGVVVGTLQIQTTSIGNTYELIMPDAVVMDLYLSGAFDDGKLHIEFDFVDCDAWFRVATEWDYALPDYPYAHYGIDISTGGMESAESPEGKNDLCIVCFADINEDGVVDVDDLLILLDDWGPTESYSDFNVDGVADALDLLILLDNWGPCPK